MFKTVDGELKVFNKTILSTQNNLKNLQTQTANLSYYTSGGNHVNLQNVPIAQPQTVSNFTKLNNAFNVYNSNLTKSTGLQNAYIKSVGTQNQALGNYLAGLKGAPASFGGYIAALTKAKLATIGLHAASIALNMALTMGVAVAISALFKGIDYLIHRTEKMQEALENSVSEFNSVTDELKSLEEELKTTTERLAELQKLADNGTISVAEEAELENLKKTNKELARKIALKQQDQAQEARDVLKDSRKNANSTVSSKYNRKTTSSGNSEYGVSVTPDEELELAIKAYETNSKALENNRGTNLEGWYEDQTEAAKNRIEEMYDLISPTIDAYEDLINAGIELEGEDKTRYEQLKKTQDAYLAYIYTLNGTKEAFEGLNAEQQRNVLLNRLIKQGLSEDVAKAIIGSISDEDLSKYWDKNFSFVPPEMKDGETAEEYGKRYAEAWAKGLEEGAKNANEMTDSLDSLSSAIKATESAFELFNEVEKDFNSTGSISAENIQKILNKFPELEDELYEYIMGMRTGASVMDLLKTKSDDMATMSIKAFKRMYLSSNSVSQDIKDDYESAFKLIGLEWDNTQSVMANVNTQIVDANGQATQTFVEQWTEACKLAGANVSTFAQGISALLGGDFYDGTSGVYRVQGKGIYYKDGSGMDGKGTNLVNVKAMELLESGQFTSSSDAYKAAYNILSNQMDKSWENQAEFERRQKEFEERMKQYAVTSDNKSSGSDKNEALDNYLKDAENRYKVHQDETKYIQELQWAHDNLTKSDKERLDITGKINEAYRDLADNRVKDLEHQIDLKKELYGEDYNSISELEEIQRVAHEEAERLRKMGYDNNSNEIQALQKTWWDAENQKLDEYSKQHEKRVRDIEHSRDMALNNNPDINTSDYYKQLQEEYHKEAERLRALDPEKYKEEIQELQQLWWDAQESIRDENRKEFDNRMELSEDYIQHSIDFGWENGDNEIAARKRVLDWIESDYYKSLIDDDEEYYKILEENRLKYIQAQEKEFDKANDFGSSILDSRKTLLQSYFDVTNSISEAQHEINKELETSKTMYEWLDEDTRKLLFNQEDYNILSKELIDIQSEADRLQRQYEYDLRNSTLETVESITSQYEMQYETLMKSYEIAKADLDIAKKKQKLNNVLNERNVRMRIDGQWQWVANTEDVANAKAELADAEYAKRVAESGLVQQQSINDLTKRQDELSVVIKKFEGGVINLDEAVTLAKNAIGSLPYALSSMYSNVLSETHTGGNNSLGGRDYSGGRTLQVGSDGNAPSGTKIGDVVQTAGGDYLVVEHGTPGSSYNQESGLSSIKIEEKNANGTRYTSGGWTALGELEPETYIDNNGHLIPINQPTIANIEAGGAVFNSEQMMNVAKLWDLANIKNLSTPNILNNSQNMKTSENYTYQMYGNMVFDGNNPEEVFKQFCDFMKHNRYKSK